MLAHRLRRWPKITSAPGQHIIFAGKSITKRSGGRGGYGGGGDGVDGGNINVVDAYHVVFRGGIGGHRHNPGRQAASLYSLKLNLKLLCLKTHKYIHTVPAIVTIVILLIN